MSTDVTTSIDSYRRVSRTDRVRIYECGRTCAHEGCATILSIYDPAKYCSAHLQELQAWRRRTELAVREVPCDDCGTPFKTPDPPCRYRRDPYGMTSFARLRRAEKRAEVRQQQTEPDEAAASVDATVEPADPRIWGWPEAPPEAGDAA